MKTYRFDYYKSSPVVGGGFTGRRGIKTVTGHDVISAARKLYRQLNRKWLVPIKLEIDGGIILGKDGFIPINPDILPEINASLYAERAFTLNQNQQTKGKE